MVLSVPPFQSSCRRRCSRRHRLLMWLLQEGSRLRLEKSYRLNSHNFFRSIQERIQVC